MPRRRWAACGRVRSLAGVRGSIPARHSASAALIQQRELDRGAGAREALEEGIGGEIRGVGFRADVRDQVAGDRGEGAGIGEDERPIPIQPQDEPRVWRERGGAPLHHPVAIEPEVGDELGAVIQDQELIFAAPSDVDDGAAGEATACGGRERTTGRGVQGLDGDDPAPAHCGADAADGGGDFGELGHRP